MGRLTLHNQFPKALLLVSGLTRQEPQGSDITAIALL